MAELILVGCSKVGWTKKATPTLPTSGYSQPYLKLEYWQKTYLQQVQLG